MRAEAEGTDPERTADPPPPGSRLIPQVVAAAVCRLFLNTARRFVYPFAPALSRGLGVPLTAVTSLIAVNQTTSMLSLVFGPLADRWGHRLMFLGGLLVLAAGMFTAGFLPFYGTVLVGMLLAGLGKSMFDPAILAYVGEKVPYRRRAMAIGALEVSWAASTLVGIPVVGILIEAYGWRAPFFALGGMAVTGLISLWFLMPGGAGERQRGRRDFGFREAFGLIRREPAALGALGFTFLFNGASDTLFVVYGVWLEGAYGLNVVALGLSATVIGTAELLGEGVSAALADRAGLSRSLVAGTVLSAAGYLVLPLTGDRLAAALAGIFGIYLFVEFTIVVALSFFTEVLPSARATMMAAYFAVAAGGRVCGALLGGAAWSLGGIDTVAPLCAAMCVLGLGSLLWGLRRLRNRDTA